MEAAQWQWLALLPHSARALCLIPTLGDCVKFSRFPHVCVGFLWVLRFPPSLKMCGLGGLAMLNFFLVLAGAGELAG